MASVELLYQCCEKIDQAADKTRCDQEFTSILTGAKGGVSEKRLATQLIIKYFTHFSSDLQDRALDTLFTLCEDDDISIRKLVIRSLPMLCKSATSQIPKVADVLTQLLQADDKSEHQAVATALLTLLKSNTEIVLETIFGHIISAEEDLLRERAVRFLVGRLSQIVLTKELESFVVEHTKKALPEVSGEEFCLLMQLLGSLPNLQTLTGRQQLLDLTLEQADLDAPFVPNDPDRVAQVIACGRQATQYLSRNVTAQKLFLFLLENVLPCIDQMHPENSSAESSGVDENEDQPQLEMLRLIADLSVYNVSVEKAQTYMQQLLEHSFTLMPAPPSQDDSENTRDPEHPELQFSDIEATLTALHSLGKRHTEFFQNNEKQNKELLKRLQYVARLIQVYSKKLKDLLKGKSKQELENEENQIKLVALRVTSNIQVLIRDMLHQPPQCRSTTTPSWKVLNSQTQTSSVGLKRQASSEEINGSKSKMARPQREIYQPPSGKFSQKAGDFPTYDDNFSEYRNGNSGFRGGRGRFRSGWRGQRSRGRGRRTFY